MEILVKRFVQNYYEVHGNFNKIELSPLSEQIREMANDAGLSINHFCISMLGYPAGTTEFDLDLFAHWQIDDISWFLENKLINKEEDLEQFIKDHKCNWQRVFRKKNNKEHKVNAAVELLTTYYNNNSELKTLIDNAQYSVKDFILLLKISGEKISVQSVIESMKKNNLLVSFKQTTGDPAVYNGVFYHNDLTENQIAKVQKEAVMNLIYGLNLRNGVIKDAGSLPFLAINSPKVYLALLDMCRGLGITYAQYVKAFGINIIDQVPALTQFNMLVMLLGDTLYVTDAYSTSKEPVQRITIEQFNTMVSM